MLAQDVVFDKLMKMFVRILGHMKRGAANGQHLSAVEEPFHAEPHELGRLLLQEHVDVQGTGDFGATFEYKGRALRRLPNDHGWRQPARIEPNRQIHQHLNLCDPRQQQPRIERKKPIPQQPGKSWYRGPEGCFLLAFSVPSDPPQRLGKVEHKRGANNGSRVANKE